MKGIRALALLAAAGLATAWKRARLFPVRVQGPSMEPTLHAGDLAAVSPRIPAYVGSVVVVRSGGREIIKRVGAISPGGIELAGDNRRASTDLVVPTDDVAGVVVARYWPRPAMLL